MGAWGAIIMGFFGAMFAAMTLHLGAGVSGASLAIPFAASVLITFIAAHILRLSGEGIVPSSRAAKAIQWSSAGEGIGLFLAANIVVRLHRDDLLLPAMALVVGLHFLPIAWAAAFVPFWLLGGALIVAAVVGGMVSGPVGAEIAGGAAALALWIAAALALRRDWRARRGAGV